MSAQVFNKGGNWYNFTLAAWGGRGTLGTVPVPQHIIVGCGNGGARCLQTNVLRQLRKSLGGRDVVSLYSWRREHKLHQWYRIYNAEHGASALRTAPGHQGLARS